MQKVIPASSSANGYFTIYTPLHSMCPWYEIFCYSHNGFPCNNSYGVIFLHTHTHMHIAAPDPVTNLQFNATETTITITWMNGFDGNTPLTGARIEYFGEDEGNVQTAIVNGSNPTTHTLMGITPFATHNITVFLMNIVGDSEPSSILSSTLSLCKYWV